jgi:hypothetical protein
MARKQGGPRLATKRGTTCRRTDPIERQIESALCPGEFIYDRACFSFVSGLDGVAAEIRSLTRSDPARATTLCEGFVIGEPVTVIAFDYDGNQRRGVTARCRRSDGREYEVAACEVVIPASLPGADYLAAYRQWMGLEPHPPAERRVRDTSLPAGAAASIDLHGAVELVVL